MSVTRVIRKTVAVGEEFELPHSSVVLDTAIVTYAGQTRVTLTILERPGAA